MVDYWHGGRRGIAEGDYIKSPHERRRQMSAWERQTEAFARSSGYNSDRNPKRVYFTTDQALARAWAMHPMLQVEGGGALYRVKPLPPSSLESDPDYEPVGFSARRAEVLEVLEDPVEMDEGEAAAARCRYTTWSGSSDPMYDDDGYLLPMPAHRALGGTAAQYRHFGRWYDLPPGYMFGVLDDGRVVVVPNTSPIRSPLD